MDTPPYSAGDGKPSSTDDLEASGGDVSTIRAPRCSIPARRVTVFGDLDVVNMKEKVRSYIMEPDPYDVSNFYDKEGLWRKIATHRYFENITLVVISLNALWMAIDTNYNNAADLLYAEPIFQIVEQFFCVYFCFEWFARFMSFTQKRDGIRDAWFIFDGLLVFMMFMETWALTLLMVAVGGTGSPLGGNTSILRLFRLLRLSRLVRMLRSMPELMILVKGMVTATKTVIYVLALLFIVLYVFAIALVQLASGTDYGDAHFAHVGLAMFSLLMHGTFLDDLAAFCTDIRAYNDVQSWVCMCLVLLVICLSTVLLNMLVGVLCEVVDAVAAHEKEETLTVNARDKMGRLVQELDTNGDRTISHRELKQILEYPEALTNLQDIGVDPVSIIDFADLFFLRDGETVDLPFKDFMDFVLDLRGTNILAVKDIHTVYNNASAKLLNTNADVAELREAMDELQSQTRQMRVQRAKLDVDLSELETALGLSPMQTTVR